MPTRMTSSICPMRPWCLMRSVARAMPSGRGRLCSVPGAWSAAIWGRLRWRVSWVWHLMWRRQCFAPTGPRLPGCVGLVRVVCMCLPSLSPTTRSALPSLPLVPVSWGLSTPSIPNSWCVGTACSLPRGLVPRRQRVRSIAMAARVASRRAFWSSATARICRSLSTHAAGRGFSCRRCSVAPFCYHMRVYGLPAPPYPARVL